MSNGDLYDRTGQSPAQPEAPLSVSQAVARAKGALEGVVVKLVGEVSEVSNKAGYKAVYFTVKDEAASLPCMMWNNRFRAAGVPLAVGSLVEITGRFTLYAAKGRMNFDVFTIALAGEGDLRLKVANLAKKLAAEGLMEPSRKRALPPYAARIGLVTSPRGAAVHDVLRTLRRRFPLADVVLAGVPVEGAGAPAGIIEGISRVCAAGAEVVLVVRGGGSFEDLMPFNDEWLARAIAACPVPVVTGIGHEPDNSIADMVADVRASTPTAAAEAVSPSRDALDGALSMRARALRTSALRAIEGVRASVSRRASRPVFAMPESLFAGEAQALDLAGDRLVRAIPASIERDAARLAQIAGALSRSPMLALSRTRDAVRVRRERLQRVGGTLTGPYAADMRLAASRLEDLSPLSVIARGYAIARAEDGTVVRETAQAAVGSRLDVTVSDGVIACRVEGTEQALRPEDERRDG